MSDLIPFVKNSADLPERRNQGALSSETYPKQPGMDGRQRESGGAHNLGAENLTVYRKFPGPVCVLNRARKPLIARNRFMT